MRSAGWMGLLISIVSSVLGVAGSQAIAASTTTSCNNKAVGPDVYLIDAKGVTCSKALAVAKKWLAADGYTFGLDDPPRNGSVIQVSGYRCVFREIRPARNGMYGRTTCSASGKVIHVGLGSGGKSEYKSCSLSGKEGSFGPTYVTSLTVRKAPCSEAESVVKAFHRCRYAKGGLSAHCTSKVLGYSCTEKRFNVAYFGYDAQVQCKRDSRVVKHSYQQNTT